MSPRVVLALAVFFSILAILLMLPVIVRGDMSFNQSVIKMVNFSVLGELVNVTTDSGTTIYNLSAVNATNQTLFISVPVTSSVNITTFNVSFELPNLSSELRGFDCSAQVSNSTAYMENLIRSQLVPSQQNYESVRAEMGNLSESCAVSKQVLIDQIMRKEFELNATVISWNATTSMAMQRAQEYKDDRDTTQVLFYIVLSLCLILLIAYAKGINFFQWLADWYNDRTGRKLRSVSIKQDVVQK